MTERRTVIAGVRRCLGATSRRLRDSRFPIRYAGRAAGRACALLARANPCELEYADAFGLHHVADLRDHLELDGFLGRFRRLPETARAHIRHGDWTIDVGANVGLISAELAHLVGRTGSVWAIEPIERNCLRLQYLKQTNRLAQLTIFQAAAAAQDGEAEITLPAGGQSGWASFSRPFDAGSAQMVRTYSLDSLKATGIARDSKVSFVKLDIEGYEIAALHGARELLAYDRPFIFCEFNEVLQRAGGHSCRELLQLFASVGYLPDTPVPPIRPASLFDLLMIPKEKLPATRNADIGCKLGAPGVNS